MTPFKNAHECILINNEKELDEILKKKESMFILFYAPWCGFSKRFLPVFEQCAQDTSKQCYRMMVDELPRLCEKYQIDVYPTIVFFADGKPSRRLDGVHGMGLTEQQFRDLIKKCELPK